MGNRFYVIETVGDGPFLSRKIEEQEDGKQRANRILNIGLMGKPAMTDVMTPEDRSFLMSRIRGKNTKLAMFVSWGLKNESD